MTALAAVTTVCLLLIGPGCDVGGPTQPGDVVFPDSNVSFGRNVQPLLQLGCAFSGCHNAIDRAGNVSFDKYIDLLNRPGLVHGGDTTNSVLWQIITERLPHTAAPIPRYITPRQVHGIAIWIEEGASDN